MIWLVVLIFFGQISHAEQRRYVEGIPLDPVEGDEPEVESGPSLILTLFASTPMLNENSYEKRASTIIPQILLAIPSGSGAIETGVRASVSRLSLTDSDFDHYFFDIPLRIRAPILVGERARTEILLGVIGRVLEHDTRTTSDGGWGRSGVSGIILGEAGLTFHYRISTRLMARLDLTTAQLGSGIEVVF